MWELFFEVRVPVGATRCQQGELTVAQLVVTGNGAEGDKLVLKGGFIGIQVLGKHSDASHTRTQLSRFNALNVNLEDTFSYLVPFPYSTII